MENQSYQNPQNYGGQIQVPNSVAVLVLGIISIVSCFCYGIVGIICGIIALVLADKGKKAYDSSPEDFTLSSFNNLKAGKICAIIGVSLSAIYLIVVIIAVVVGTGLGTLPWTRF
jgi:hypothetical protein